MDENTCLKRQSPALREHLCHGRGFTKDIKENGHQVEEVNIAPAKTTWKKVPKRIGTGVI